MKDIVFVAGIVVAFAVLVTAHVAIVWGLAFRAPRWRALLAFFTPAAPYFAWRERMRVRLWVWLGALSLYVVFRILA